MNPVDQDQPQRPSLLRTLLELLRLRASPAEIAYAPAALMSVVALDVAISLLYLYQVSDPLALQRILFSVAVTLALTWFLLWQLNKSARFVQTCIALVGVDALLTLALLPLAMFALQQGKLDPESPQAQGLAMVWLAIQVWSLLVGGHIYRRALDFPFAGGVAIALGMFITQVALGQWLFPAVAA